ncbi:carboxypeptidase M32 [Paenisporosarcina antarctica]|uniref:Metal-dependent carboxypeptidase n=1 Tax=Paenisporosarcina antarctica TaxID=417367 RepID=A0A4P6ZY98_9BACL|nr:carboxypeptidase M32 [Paenisporosarcina antarctica]QBP41293.1 carboxypeptidase M32 [Paenisporosarcina antarctica]
METTEKFINYVKKMQAYSEAIGLMYWDLRTGAPKKGIEQRSQVIGTLSSEVFGMQTSDELAEMLVELENNLESLDLITKRTVEKMRKEYNMSKKIPADEYRDFVILTSKAESVWEEAKEKSDFSLFFPYLKEIVETTKRFVSFWGVKDNNPYNTLLNEYEPGMTTEILDNVFGELRNKIVPLAKKIAESPNQPKTDFLFKYFPKEKQKQFSLDILKQLGYDFNAGRLDETVHPFATGLNRGDVRITTKYDENDFRTAIFGTIHECGHALYEQNISAELEGLPLSTGTSMGIHESQSLFYENFVGRNEKFWEQNFSTLQAYAPEQFGHVAVMDFLAAINESKSSLIRIEADELTYPLHIMIRYEIEKGLFNGDMQVEELPQIWNDKYEEYLGVRPTNDAEGILQDVHWAGGAFGYFPSYALGFLYASQLKSAMLIDLPHFDDLCANGNLEPIKDWLTEKVHRHGSMKKPLEILQDATGEGLNATYLVEYLEEKYGRIYQLV